MSTEKHIQEFYEAVERLGLRFPLAEIVDKTGFSKSSVSEYLNKKKVPSANFIKAFYKAFPGSIKVPPTTPEASAKIGNANYSQAAIAVLMQRISFLLSQKTGRSEIVELQLIKKDAEDLMNIGGA